MAGLYCTHVLTIFTMTTSCIMITGGLESGIVGGKEVKPHSRPYMASLQVGREHKCGGMLIRDDYVLTSGHCYKWVCTIWTYFLINNVLTWCSVVITTYNNLNIKCFNSKTTDFCTDVVLGAHNISQKEDSQQIIQVDKYIRHPNYEHNQRTYDIMLLKVLLLLKLGGYFFIFYKTL